jgi:hypothetical protein
MKFTSAAKKIAIVAACAGAAHITQALASSSSTAAAFAASVQHNDTFLSRNVVCKKNGRYRRSGAIPSPEQSFWRSVDMLGDDQEFFHFISLTRESFGDLVELCKDKLLSEPLRRFN